MKREVKKASVAKAKYTVPDVERNSEGVAFFYFRSEPTTRMVNGKDVKFSIQDLKDEPNSTAHWDGVRNYSARNWMRAMRTGDRGFFYHSNAGPDLVGIVGTVTIVKEAYPDHTAWDSGSPYFDAKSSPENPKWEMVDVKIDEIFDSVVTRETLKSGPLGDAYMIKMGRTSVGPVSVAHWEAMLKIAKGKNVEG